MEGGVGVTGFVLPFIVAMPVSSEGKGTVMLQILVNKCARGNL
jgi:hypothetical protein